MSTVRQMFHLQELDLEIARVEKERSSLEGHIGERSVLLKCETALQAAQERHQKLKMDHSDNELKAGSIRTKLESDRAKLYGGTVTNLKELQGLEQETTSLAADLQKRDEALIAMMEELEESNTALVDAEQRNSTQAVQWKSDQAEFTKQWQQLGESLENLTEERKETAGILPPTELRRYESLRTSKGGVAVARVERGLCRGCLMTLPTHQMQKARMAREPITCNSCGRLLFLS